MKYFIFLLTIALMLAIDGALTYDIFDSRTWSFANTLCLLLIFFIIFFIAWAEHTKNSKNNDIQR